MKRIILSLILILSFAFSNAQKTDSTYVADSSLYVYNVDIGWTDSVKQKANVNFIFHKNSTVTIRDTSRTATFVVDSILDTVEEEDTKITVYQGHIDDKGFFMGVCMYENKLFSVGLFNAEGSGFILFITGKPQLALLNWNP